MISIYFIWFYNSSNHQRNPTGRRRPANRPNRHRLRPTGPRQGVNSGLASNDYDYEQPIHTAPRRRRPFNQQRVPTAPRRRRPSRLRPAQRPRPRTTTTTTTLPPLPAHDDFYYDDEYYEDQYESKFNDQYESRYECQPLDQSYSTPDKVQCDK